MQAVDYVFEQNVMQAVDYVFEQNVMQNFFNDIEAALRNLLSVFLQL